MNRAVSKLKDLQSELSRSYLEYLPYSVREVLSEEKIDRDFFSKENELTLKVYFLFSSDEDHRFYEDKEIREQVLDQLQDCKEEDKLTVSRVLIHSYFEAYPFGKSLIWSKRLHRKVKEFVCRVPGNEIFEPLFEDDALDYYARLYQGGGFSKFIFQIGYGYISNESQFVSLIWEKIADRYPEILSESLQEKTVSQILDEFHDFLFATGRWKAEPRKMYEICLAVALAIQTKKELCMQDRARILDLIGILEKEDFQALGNDYLSDKLSKSIHNIRCILTGEKLKTEGVLEDFLRHHRPKRKQPKPESQQSEPLKPELQQSEPLKPESQQSEPLKPESQQPEPLKPESQQPESPSQKLRTIKITFTDVMLYVLMALGGLIALSYVLNILIFLYTII